MPVRKIIFSNNEYYHIFNRTVGREDVFSNKRNIDKAIEIIDYYRYPSVISLSHVHLSRKAEQVKIIESRKKLQSLVEIHAFTLMPNHHHFVLKQLQDNGIQQFIANFQNSFAKYFNTKFDRHGTLFTNPFKAVWIGTHQQFIHVVRYVHLNLLTSFLVDMERLSQDSRTSFGTYVGGYSYDFIETADNMEYFKTLKKYQDFVFNQVDYQRKLKEIRSLLLDAPRV